jgi:hypothetical protein
VYTIAMPSPLHKTASQKALTAENEELCSLLRAAGVELEKNHAQMALMERENVNIRQRLYAKKNKKKRAYTTGQAWLMTSAEMHEALLKDLQKKQMGELHSELKKKVFPGIRKSLSDTVKAAKAKAKQEAQEAKAAEKAAEKAAAKAAKAAARGRGRTRRRGSGEASGAHGHGGAKTRGRGAAGSDDDEQSGSESEPSDEEHNSDVQGSSASSDEEPNFQGPMGTPPSPGVNDIAPTVQDDSDDEDDEGETEIDSFNGHRWEARRNLQFQVIWTDGDVTWKSLANVNDCAAMEDYLAHRDVDDPLLLPKHKYLIKTTLRASNK